VNGFAIRKKLPTITIKRPNSEITAENRWKKRVKKEYNAYYVKDDGMGSLKKTNNFDVVVEPVNNKVMECLQKPITFDVVLEPRHEENQVNSDDDFDIVANNISTMKYNEATKRVDLKYDVFIHKSLENQKKKLLRLS
jgi:predicted Ser/Thr protein kinase